MTSPSREAKGVAPHPHTKRRHAIANIALCAVMLLPELMSLTPHTSARQTDASWLLDAVPELGAATAHAQRRRRRARASIEISTDVGGAEIFIDGEPVGVTPLEGPIPVSPGEHVVKISRRGYTEFLETFTIPRGRRPFLVEAILIPVNGIFLIETKPAGARVVIDGRFLGETPFDGDIPEGTRQVEIGLPGHQLHSQVVDVVGGETYDLNLTLEPIPEVTPFYARWTFWAGVGAATVGVVALSVVLSRGAAEPEAPTGPPRVVLPLIQW